MVPAIDLLLDFCGYSIMNLKIYILLALVGKTNKIDKEDIIILLS
jgi:hypothetical protein